VHLQVVALLQEMGLDAHDTRPIKKAGLNGAELLLLEEPQLMELLGLPKHKARRLRRLQVCLWAWRDKAHHHCADESF
jgi:hypothetical protein